MEPSPEPWGLPVRPQAAPAPAPGSSRPNPAIAPDISGVSPRERRLLLEAGGAQEGELAALRRELQGLRRLLEVTRELSSILDHDRLLEAVLDSAILLTGAERGLLLLADGERLEIIQGRGKNRESLDPGTSRISETLARQCMLENRVIPHDNIANLPEFQNVRSIQALDLSSAVSVPLRERGVPIGVLYLDSSIPSLQPSQQELVLLEAFASQASVSLLNARLMRGLEESRLLLTQENQNLRAEARASSGIGSILGQSTVMLALFDKIRLLKDADIPVLLLGESGTGKELVARALHYEGIHRDGPFVPLNCAGFPEDLLDSLMFGYRRGAFTGAIQDRPGLVERSHGGTLFLDEISDMPLALQTKLLRFLENFEFRRVGETETRSTRTRVISATNKDLAAMVRDKTFREDLFFRLAGVHLEIPPLRERRDDLRLLVDYFMKRAQERVARRIGGITDGARRFITKYPWPGNVRQLKYAIESACALVPEGRPVDEVHLKMQLAEVEREMVRPQRTRSLHDSKAQVEQELLGRVLAQNDWNITRSAQELGISRQHLHNRVRKYNLRRPGKS
jgi:Nif-specific regulatory protein